MTEHPAVTALRERAAARQKRTGDAVVFYTDAQAFARAKKPAVLVAIARPGIAFVMAIDVAEFTWDEQLMFANLCGIPDAESPDAMERAVLQKRK